MGRNERHFNQWETKKDDICESKTFQEFFQENRNSDAFQKEVGDEGMRTEAVVALSELLVKMISKLQSTEEFPTAMGLMHRHIILLT